VTWQTNTSYSHPTPVYYDSPYQNGCAGMQYPCPLM